MNNKEIIRFQKKIELDILTGCWLWKGGTNHGGYGLFYTNKMRPVHRVSYEHWNGPIPKDLQIDHLCRNPSCVNPAHLEAVTQKVNIRRGREYTKQFCKNGHPRTPENMYEMPSGKGRDCKICVKNRNEKFKSLNPEKVRKYKRECERRRRQNGRS
jgi:hypothetical protein